MIPKTVPSPRLKPLYYLTRRGYWRLLDQEHFRARLQIWKLAHPSEYAAMDESIRGCISKWLNGSPVTYYGVQRIAEETHCAVAYWSGVREAPQEEIRQEETRQEETRQEEEPPRQQRVDRYWIRDGGGQLVLAPEYLDGYLQRIEELLGAQMTGWGRWPRNEGWQDRRRRWRRGEARPSKCHVLEICLRTQTRLSWWLTGEGQVWAIRPPELPATIQMTPHHSRDYPAPTPDDHPRAPVEEPAAAPSPPLEPAPYNFFAGCIS